MNLLRYIALMLHPGLITPTDIERCMQMAFNAKFNSCCLSRQVGAVITDEKYYIKAVGWNDVPQNQVPCSLRCLKKYFSENDKNTFSKFEINDDTFRKTLRKINKSYSELSPENNELLDMYDILFCFKDIYNGIKDDKNQVYTRSLHAEENAFLQASKFGGQGIQGGKLFVTASPCELCSKKSYQLGIRDIYYIDPYPGISATHILKHGDDKHNPKLNLFYGAIGNAYVSLYTQRFARKDELQLMSSINMKTMAKQSNKGKSSNISSYNDLEYNKVSLTLTFNNRYEVEFLQEMKFSILKSNIQEIVKSFSWTGSNQFTKTEISGNGNYSIEKESFTDGIHYYTVKFEKPLRVGDNHNIKIKTVALDEQEVMNPILFHHVKFKTNDLKMTVRFKKDGFNGQKPIDGKVKFNIYADINKNILFETSDKEVKETKNYYEFSVSVQKPMLLYTYAFKWGFIKIF